MYVSSIEIKDFRGFEHASVDFVHPTGSSRGSKKKKSTNGDDSYLPNVTLLIGVNGAGKTSILRSIALSILAPIVQESGYRPYHLVRKGAKSKSAMLSGQVTLHGQDIGSGFKEESGIMSKPVAEITVKHSYEKLRPKRELPEFEQIYDDDSPAYFVVGYGATRRVEQVEHLDSQMSKRRGARYQRVAGLFEDYITLFPLGVWFPRLRSTSSKRADEIVKTINEILPEDTSWSGDVDDFEPTFQHRGTQLPFGALSDGYRSYIGLVADLLYHLQDCCPAGQKLASMSGVVLLDDIDLHLHPCWQREVVQKFATAFPRLQFILTSHSPLVAGSLHERNVRVIEDGGVHEFQERLHGLNADQVLTSSYFGLNSTRSVEMEDRLKELELDVSKRGDPDAAIAYLRELTLEEKNGEH